MNTCNRRTRNQGSRTTIACDACRRSKIKCSGTNPCSACHRRSVPCITSDGSRRIVVSERYLKDLHRRARQSNDSTPLLPNDEVQATSSPDQSEEYNASPLREVQNDLNFSRECTRSEGQNDHNRNREALNSPPPTSPTFIKDERAVRPQWLYISRASSWSFIFNATLILKEALNLESMEGLQFALDGDCYPLDWRSPLDSRSGDIRDVPAEDYTLFALNAVKFHLGQLLRFFDEEVFTREVIEFYHNPQQKVVERPLWFVQLLVVLAFGKAFLIPALNQNQPPGFDYFARALSLLPTVPEGQSDPVLMVEVLAMISLYMYCIDMRGAAYTYLGQAARLAMFLGLHTPLPPEKLGDALARHCSSLWWTIYVLDGHLSSATGCPTVVHDQSIPAPLPSPSVSLQRQAIFELNIKVSRLMFQILRAVNFMDAGIDRLFLERTKSQLKSLANLARELEDTVDRILKSSVQSDLTTVSRIMLSYHECAIFATRPVLLVILKEKLTRVHERRDVRCDISPNVKPLIEACVNSAAKTMDVLTKQSDNSMLETFLPFRLESLFSATTVIQLVEALLPSELKRSGLVEGAFTILDSMITRGNKIAVARKRELEHLQNLLQRINDPANTSRGIEYPQAEPSMAEVPEAQQPDYRLLQNMLHPGPNSVAEAPRNDNVPLQLDNFTGPPDLNDDFMTSFGLSSDAIDLVADQVFDESFYDQETLLTWTDG